MIQRQLKLRVWSWRGIKGPPVVFKTKKEAVASFELYESILIDRKAGRL